MEYLEKRKSCINGEFFLKMEGTISVCNNGLSFLVFSDIEYSDFSSLWFAILQKQTMIIAHIEVIINIDFE